MAGSCTSWRARSSRPPIGPVPREGRRSARATSLRRSRARSGFGTAAGARSWRRTAGGVTSEASSSSTTTSGSPTAVRQRRPTWPSCAAPTIGTSRTCTRGEPRPRPSSERPRANTEALRATRLGPDPVASRALKVCDIPASSMTRRKGGANNTPGHRNSPAETADTITSPHRHRRQSSSSSSTTSRRPSCYRRRPSLTSSAPRCWPRTPARWRPTSRWRRRRRSGLRRR
jgi:hypothetical protein